jgi:D-tyrosyl-tRNA(Tyr) deacylase
VRAVVSRVSTATVTVDGTVVGSIGTGLLSLVGVGREDDVPRSHRLAAKIHELRIFPTDDGARSAADLGLPVLVISQFTLYADTRKGRRPSWQDAAPGRGRRAAGRRGGGRTPAPGRDGGHRDLRREDAGRVGERGADDTRIGDMRLFGSTAAPTSSVVPRLGRFRSG